MERFLKRLALTVILALVSIGCTKAQTTIPGGSGIPGGTNIQPAADVTGPSISAIVCTPTSTTIACTWTTNEPATTVLARGIPLGPPYSTSCANDAGLVTSHSATCGALASSTLYDLQLTSADVAGNSTNSAEQNVTTSAAGAATPNCGNTTLDSLVPNNRYQSFVSTIIGDGATTTVVTTGAHDLATGNYIHIQSTTAYNTTKGSPVQITLDGVSPTTKFSFTSTVNAAQETSGIITWVPVTTSNGTFVNTPFSCTERRLVNFETSARSKIPYSTFMLFSPDETKVMMLDGTQSAFEVRNVSDGTIYRTVSQLGTLSSSASPRWKNNDIIYFFQSNLLKEKNITTLDAATTAHTFSGCTDMSTKSTGDWDFLRDRIAVRCQISAGNYSYFSYQRSVDTDGLSGEGGRYGPTTSSSDFPFITEANDGGFLVWWNTAGTGNEQGVQLYDSTGTRVRQVLQQIPHGRPARNASSVDVIVALRDSSQGGACNPSGLNAIRIDNSVETCLFTQANLGRDGHVSVTSHLGSRPGWASFFMRRSSATGTAALVQSLPTTWATTWASQATYNEGVIAKMDGTGSWRLTHHNGRHGGNVAQGVFGNFSPNGTYIIYNSSRGTCNNFSPACSPSNGAWTEPWILTPF